MDKIKKLTVDDIITWILENKNDIDAMDKISYLSFSHSSKFKAKQAEYRQRSDIDNGISFGN